MLHWCTRTPTATAACARAARTTCCGSYGRCANTSRPRERRSCAPSSEPYLFSPPLKDEEHDRCERPEKSAKSAVLDTPARHWSVVYTAASESTGCHIPAAATGTTRSTESAERACGWAGSFAYCAARAVCGVAGAARRWRGALSSTPPRPAARRMRPQRKWYLRPLCRRGSARRRGAHRLCGAELGGAIGLRLQRRALPRRWIRRCSASGTGSTGS